MKIILFTNRDLESNLAYHILKPELLKHDIRVYLSDGVGHSYDKPEDLVLLESFETTYFYQEIPRQMLQANLLTHFEFFNQDFYSAPLEVCHQVNAPAFIREIQLFAPDLFISIRFGKIFHRELIEVPTKGILNLHSGILPDYRGILGTLHALREGKRQVGCTLHYINNASIDTGAIVDIGYLNTDPEHSLFWHVVNLYPLGCNMIIDSLRKLEHTPQLPTFEQDLEQGRYYSVPRQVHFLQLRDRGYEVINPIDYWQFIEQWISPELGEILEGW